MGSKRPTSCYLCGAPADTADHIPPKGFFPAPCPSNLITVPACGPCNKSFEHLDAEFRNFVASSEQRSSAGNRIVTEKVLSPNSTVRPAFWTIANTLSPVEVQVGNIRALKWKLSYPAVKAERFLGRLALGMQSHLLPHLHGRLHSDIYVTNVSFDDHQTRATLQPIAGSLKWGSRGEGVFEYAFGYLPDYSMTLWLFCFYEAQWFFVMQAFNGGRFDAIFGDRSI